MHKMNNLEYSFIVRELSQLVSRHFDRIRKLGEGIYRMKIGTQEVICELGTRIHFTSYLEQSELKDKFMEKTDKELDNAKLLAVRQVNNDRIIAFEFDRGTLIFEMFSGGNAVLVQDGKTTCAAKHEKWSDREIAPGVEYRPPKTAPSAKLEIEVSDKYIIVSLMKLPFGKEYALEALARCGIDEKTPGNSLSGNALTKLEHEMENIETNATPYCVYKDNKLVDFSLAMLSRATGCEWKTMPTLSAAADEYYLHAEKPNPKLEKLNERLEKQQERMVELVEEEKGNKASGDHIYANYQKAEEFIALAKAGKFDELGSKHNAKIDKKEKTIEIEL